MDSQSFHQMLQAIKDVKNREQNLAAEKAYLEFREKTPSDNFMELLVNEVVTPSDVQEYAQVLLNQDIEKNCQSAALYRLSDPQHARKLIIQLLQFLAQNPKEKMAQIISSYAVEELTQQRDFPELWGFIEQGYESPNEDVRKVVLYIVSEILVTPQEVVQNIKFDFMTFLQKVLSDTSDKVVKYAVISLGNMLVNDQDEEGNHVLISNESYGQIM